jgi:hypothetical protein
MLRPFVLVLTLVALLLALLVPWMADPLSVRRR